MILIPEIEPSPPPVFACMAPVPDSALNGYVCKLVRVRRASTLPTCGAACWVCACGTGGWLYETQTLCRLPASSSTACIIYLAATEGCRFGPQSAARPACYKLHVRSTQPAAHAQIPRLMPSGSGGSRGKSQPIESVRLCPLKFS